MSNAYIMIMVMCATKMEATKIAHALLRKKLVACANIMGGVRSKFWWKARIDKASETLLMMKTVKANFKKAAALIKKLHSYDVPEIIAIPIVAGNRDYLDWIDKSLLR